MALPTKTWQIDGTSYKTTVLPATDSRGLYFRLLQGLAPALEALGAAEEDKAEQAMGTALARVIGGLDPKLFEDLCQAMCRTTCIQRPDGEDSLDGALGGMHFAGRLTVMVKCLGQWLKAQGMLDFLGEISRLANLAAILTNKSGSGSQSI